MKIQNIITVNLMLLAVFASPAHAFGPKAKAEPTKPVVDKAVDVKPALVKPVAVSKPVEALQPTATEVPALKTTVPTKPANVKKVAVVKKAAKPKPVLAAKSKSEPEIVAKVEPVRAAEVVAEKPRTELEKVSDATSGFFSKLKTSVKNGATERICEPAARALNQC